MKKEKNQKDRTRGKVEPDQGQGSEGTFGQDGDHGKSNEESKKSSNNSSPVPIKKAK